MISEKIHFIGKEETLLVEGASCIMTMKETQDSFEVLENFDILIEGGKVKEVLPHGQVSMRPERIINARGMTLMPGLIDSHHHPVFAGNRGKETVQKAQGLSYEEIAEQGGGIQKSMKETRAASEEELSQNFSNHMTNALNRGVVLCEAKTGYGLNVEEELKQLRIIYKTCAENNKLPHIAPTFLGPHAASPEYPSLSEYIDTLIDALPQIVDISQSNQKPDCRLAPLAADIFIERGYFQKEHGDKWLSECLQHGLNIHIHADEFSRSGGAELAYNLAARIGQKDNPNLEKGKILSIDHGQYTSETDLIYLAQNHISLCVLPITSFFSKIPFLEAKKLRPSGIKVAIATDHNPGSAPINNLWFAGFLALTRGGFHMHEVLKGVTSYAALALGMENSFGTIEEGKPAHILAYHGNGPEDFFESPLGDHMEFVITQ